MNEQYNDARPEGHIEPQYTAVCECGCRMDGFTYQANEDLSDTADVFCPECGLANNWSFVASTECRE
jgi:hypothetical protein